MALHRSKLDAWQDRLPERGEWSGVADDIGLSPEALYREIARRWRLDRGSP